MKPLKTKFVTVIYLITFALCAITFAEPTVPIDPSFNSPGQHQGNTPANPNRPSPTVPIIPPSPTPEPQANNSPKGPNQIQVPVLPPNIPQYPNQPNLDDSLKRLGGNFSFPIHINGRSLCQATLTSMAMVAGELVCTAVSASHCFGGRGGMTRFRTPKNFFGSFTAKVSIAPGSRGQGNYHDAALITFKGAPCRRGQQNQVPPIAMLPAGKKLPVGSQVFWASSREAKHGGKIFKGRVIGYDKHVVTINTYNKENNSRGKNWGGIEGDSGGGLFYREMVNGVPQYYIVGVCSTRDNTRVRGMTGFKHLNYHNGPGFRWMKGLIAKIMGQHNLPDPQRPPGNYYAQNPQIQNGPPGTTPPAAPIDPMKPRAATIPASLNY